MTGVVILAAGASVRLGRPKQLLQFKGKTLLQHAIDEALKSRCELVVVVLGANAEEIKNDIQNKAVTLVINRQWEQGMGSGISLGISEMLKVNSLVSNVILMVTDQPFVDSALIDNLIAKKLSSLLPIVACFYNNTLGVPALFSANYFNELKALTGQEGAKKILLENKAAVEIIDFPNGAIDIDTFDDYNNLLSIDNTP